MLKSQTYSRMKEIARQLESVISPAAICDWESLDPVQQKRLQQVIASLTPPECVVYPQTLEELAAVVACAHNHDWRILPCGSSSKLNWGGLATGVELVVSTARLNQIVQHAVGDLTVTAAAGTKLVDLQAKLATAGQFLALDPAMADTATIGGIIATADAGSLRQRYRGVRDQLLGITFVRADGAIAKAGGRVVKNVAGYDLMKLFTGSYGTLGIIAQATFRVYPLPETTATVVLTGEAEAIAQAAASLRAGSLTPIKADLLSTQMVKQLSLAPQGLGLMLQFGNLAASVKQQSAILLELGQQLGLQGTVFSATDEANLWEKLATQIWQHDTAAAITCKIGVMPATAVATLTQLEQLAPLSGVIHTGIGLGTMRITSPDVKPSTLTAMRSLCQTHAGFLTILAAPASFKQQLDVWGYSGNALDVMRQLKQQFDPKQLLSPQRFVGGI